jgi:hypothetical protein
LFLAINLNIILSSKMREHIQNLKTYCNLCFWLYFWFMELNS